MIMNKSTNRNKKDGAEMTYAEYQEYMRNFFEQYYPVSYTHLWEQQKRKLGKKRDMEI